MSETENEVAGGQSETALSPSTSKQVILKFQVLNGIRTQ